MTKALLKKQMLEVFSWLYRDRKSGKNRSKSGLLAYALLYAVLFGFLGFIFYGAAEALCEPLAAAGMGWLYFAIMGLLATAFGVFGSVFNTFASLYQAKDNELLLSMPVRPSGILLARLFGVYVMGLLYELIVMIPALIAFFIYGSAGVLGVIFALLIPFVLSVLVLTLSCILGWAVALVHGRVKNKSIVTVALSLIFLAGYYYLYSQAYSILQRILENPQAVGDSVKSILFPFYHMGLAAQGNAVSMLIFAAITAAAFGAVYLVLSRSFLKLATANRGAARVKYKEKAAKASSVDAALLRKELRRFVSSPTYMLNCGLGVVMMLVAAAALFIKGSAFSEMLHTVFEGSESVVYLLAAAAVCMLSAMNDITAPSVSLEGKNIWLVQAFPVTGWQALRAKLHLHLLLTLPPMLALVAAAEIVIKPPIIFAVLIPLVSALFVLFMAELGLALNLKSPNLKWTNETVPVKQSMSVMLALFGGWAAVLALGALYFAVGAAIGAALYLLLCGMLLGIAALLLFKWLKTKGQRIFEAL